MKSNYIRISRRTPFPFSKVILLLTFISALLFSNESKATHAMGMDLTYVQLSQDSFLVTLAFYRDCAGVSAPNSASLRVRSASCNYNFTINLPRVGNGTETTPVCTSLVTQCNGGNFPGSEEYIYQRIVVLPAQCTDWTLSNQICCRNNAITTINNPGNQNIYVEAKINNYYLNSSPVFSNPPVPFVCANQSYCFNNGALDQEGDSLVYSLVTPRTGINAGDTITFKPGFSKFNPISSNPQITLDSITGDLCMFPTDSTEIAVLAVLVEEYRNGVKISSIMRDIQLRILGCPNGNSLPSASGIDSTTQFFLKACANSNLTFQIFTNDPDTAQDITMTWNQGIPAASFNISTGSRPVGTFSWTPTITDVRSQPYCFTVTVTDENCPFNGQQVFSYCIYVVGVQAIADSLFHPTCFGSCDGRATARVVNGIPPFQYFWNDSLGQTTARATGLCAGNYLVTGIDSTGCTTTTTVTLDDPREIELFLSSLPVSCAGGNDGVGILDSLLYHNPPISIQWENSAGSQTTDSAFNLTSGFYSVQITDSLGCEASDSVEIMEPLPLNLTMVKISDVSCNGLNDGEAYIQVSGGTAPYNYQWDSLSEFQTTDTAFNLLAGLHTVTITDANGCISMDTLTITEPPSAITLTLSTVDINCTGDSTGSATVVPSGGTPPYFYAWSANTGAQTTQTASNLPAGTYSVIVTDINDCVALPNIVITEPAQALAIAPIDSFVACNGFTNGVAGVDVNGGTTPYSFLWSVSAGSQTTQYASGLGAGTYQVNVTDSLGCEDSVDVQILEADTPLTVSIGRVNVTCNNGIDGRAFVTVAGGLQPYTIQWDSASGNQMGDTAFNLGAGNYSVSIVDSFGCTVDTGIIVTEPPPLLTLNTASTNVACFGDSTGTASVVVSGGTPPYLYQWSANTGGQTNDTAFNLPAGTYTVTVFDSNYCVTSPGIVITQPSASVFSNVTVEDANCFNGNDGYAVASAFGGTPPYTYEWDANAGNQTNDTAFNLGAGNYTVTVRDSLNCPFDTTVAVSQPSAPLQMSLSANPVLCFNGGDGIATASASGGTAPYTFAWGALSGFQTNDTATNLPSGYHVLTLSDTNMCSITDSVFVGGPAEPLLLSTNSFDVSCFEGSDGIAVAQGSGGTAPYNYLWDSNAGNQANDTAFNLQAGSYTVTINDTNGCDTSLSVLINEPLKLEDSVYVSSSYGGANIRCFGDSNGAATAVPFGGTAPYTFLWDSTSNNQATATATNLSEGNYSVIITDTNGCTTTGFVSLSSPQKMGFNVGQITSASCYGGNDGSAIVSGYGGTAPYTYAWDSSAVILSTDSILSNAYAGTYRVELTDTNNCTYDTLLTINEPPDLLIDSVLSTDAICFGGSSGTATAYASGGTGPYSFRWQISPGVFQLTQTAVNLSAGSYAVTVSDDNNCMKTDTAFIGEPTQVMVQPSASDTTCASDTVAISATGSGGDSSSYRFIWLPPRPDSNAVQIVSPNQTTSYAVRAMDAKGCLSNPMLITIAVRTMDNDSILVRSEGDICEGDTTSVTGFHNGPFGNYTLDWNIARNGFGPHLVSPDSARYYRMTVSDICGNSISDSVLVQVFENPEFNIDSIIAEGCQTLSVSFDDTSNSEPSLEYFWEFGDGNGSANRVARYDYEEPGTYDVTLTITNNKGCETSNENSPSKVIVHPIPSAAFTSAPSTADMRNPVVQLTNQSRDAVSYHWRFGDGDTSNLENPSHTFADTGSYTILLIATTDKGCLDTSFYDFIVRAYYDIRVPNAFSPSGSSAGSNWRNDPMSNRIFYPYTENPEAVVDFEMLVFNRWGELIFESNNIYVGWDGFFRSQPSPQEVYVFKLKVRFENGQTFEKVGDVTLFR